jgi:hypothetical protein
LAQAFLPTLAPAARASLSPYSKWDYTTIQGATSTDLFDGGQGSRSGRRRR